MSMWLLYSEQDGEVGPMVDPNGQPGVVPTEALCDVLSHFHGNGVVVFGSLIQEQTNRDMTEKRYRELCIEFTQNEAYVNALGTPELIRAMAVELFVNPSQDMMRSLLEDETRKQLISLKREGVHTLN